MRRGAEAWARGDFDTAYAYWHPEVEWDPTHFEGWPDRTISRGPDEVRRFLEEEWLASWDDFEAHLEDVVSASGDRVVVFWLQRMTGRGSGVPVEMRMTQICTVRDGRIVRFENYTDRDEALKAAGL